ncbi:MAG: redoxin domain-containing protein [candidate division WOR-3 bacterium]|nr:redoxin domain-containing protein [candidate division WOR-3 bacterium]
MKARTLFAGLLMLAALLPGTALAVLNVGDQAPDFDIPDTAWVNHHLTEWRGKVVLLQFWQQF